MIALPHRSFSRVWHSVVLVAIVACAAGSSPVLQAAGITNVTVVNVTPSSFTLLWRAPESTPWISVYADAAGTSNLAGQLAIQAFPLHTGSPLATNNYERRQSLRRIRERTRGFGLMQVQVSGCRPNTTYYYRLSSTLPSAATLTYPASGPLPGVRTATENSFVLNAQQLVLDLPGLDNEGRVVLLQHPDAAYPLSAVVGDGTPTNQVLFPVTDLLDALGTRNLALLGSETFRVDLWGPNDLDEVRSFDLAFSPDFAVALAARGSFGGLTNEFASCTLGSTITRAGTTGNLPLTLDPSVGVAALSFRLRLAAPHLTNFVLQPLASELDPASLSVIRVSPTNYQVNLGTRAGQVLQGRHTVAQLNFSSPTNLRSTFIPMQLDQLLVQKRDGAGIASVLGQAGRVVLVGREPLLEGNFDAAGRRRLMLYGIAGTTYELHNAAAIRSPTNWHVWKLVSLPPTAMELEISGVTELTSTTFYRAAEFTGNTGYLLARAGTDHSRSLLVFGRPGTDYVVQYATNLSGVVTWRPLLSYRLTNSPGIIPGLSTNENTIFYRLQQSR